MRNIYLAPLQGMTDSVFRKAITEFYPVVAKTFTPFFSCDVKSRARSKNYENQLSDGPAHCIPQFISKDGEKLAFYCRMFNSYGFSEFNLNLGCPFPTVTKKGRGSSLLQYPAQLDRLFDAYFTSVPFSLSVKVRLGFADPHEIYESLPVLNKYPLKEIIVHPRTAEQKYEGVIDKEALKKISDETDLPLVYNGEIVSYEDYKSANELYTFASGFMIGRGILYNPALFLEIEKGTTLDQAERTEVAVKLFQRLFSEYRELLCGDTQFLQKVKNICSYIIPKKKEYKKEFKRLFKSHSTEEVYELAALLLAEVHKHPVMNFFKDM